MRFQIIILVLLTCASVAETGLRCGTQDVYEAMLRGETRERPPDGPIFIYTPNFIVHYDTVGIHACTPAYAESIAVYAEYVRALEVGGLGFAAPPPDAGGPDSRYDIYVQDISPWHGYTYWGIYYPNPYPGGRASYFLVTVDMNWEMLLDIVAHEFNHGCQARYSGQYNWFYENTATWMEDFCNEDYNWYILDLNTIPSPLTTPNMDITTTTNNYEYAAAIWAMFLDEYYGFSCMRLIWEEIGQVGGDNTLSAINYVLQNYDSDLKTALGNYAVWRYFTGARADTSAFFKESDLMPTSYVNPAHQHTGPGSGDQGTNYLQGPGGCSFIEFSTTPDYLLLNSLSRNPDAEWLISSIGYNSPTDHDQFMMDTLNCWAVTPSTLYETTVMVPTVTSALSNVAYDYSGDGISYTPGPSQDPEIEVVSILSPQGIINPCSSITPEAVFINNASVSAIDTAWASFYCGTGYCDSRMIDPLGPGQVDTVSFSAWSAMEHNSIDVLCVCGGTYDDDLQNNFLGTSVTVALSDFEILEILSPRGVIAKNDTVVPSARICNNGSSANTVTVTFAVDSYIDTQNLYLEPGSSGNLIFDDWLTPGITGVCSTSCFLTVSDEIPCNDIINGEVLVLYPALITLTGELTESGLLLSWSPRPGTSAYWIYGAENHPWFVPGVNYPWQFRLDVLPPSQSCWESQNGIGDPVLNWIYLVMAVDDTENELARSNRVGEWDFEGYDR